MNKPRSRKDIFAVIVEFEEKTVRNKPTLLVMKEEVRMMDFKIRPVQGDLSTLDLTSSKFIEALWCIGKLDELFQSTVYRYNEHDRELFSQFATSLQSKYTQELQHIMVADAAVYDQTPQVEIEIYRETAAKHGIN